MPQQQQQQSRHHSLKATRGETFGKVERMWDQGKKSQEFDSLGMLYYMAVYIVASVFCSDRLPTFSLSSIQ